MEVQWFILGKTFVFQGFRWVPSFSKGGGGEHFSGVGVKMLISIELMISQSRGGGWWWMGGSRPYPTMDPRMHSILELVIFLAPFNYIGTHYT